MSKEAFRRYRRHLGPEELFRLRPALMVALGLTRSSDLERFLGMFGAVDSIGRTCRYRLQLR